MTHTRCKDRLLACLLALCWLAAAPANATESGLLWRIDTEPAASYLFATMHSGDPRLMRLAERLAPRVAALRQVLLETTLDPAALRRMQAAMWLPENESLATQLGEARYLKVVSGLEAQGIPRKQAARLRPWAAYLSLSMPASREGSFLDARLAAMAREVGVPVDGLETVSEQLEVLAGLAPDVLNALLDEALRQLPDLEEEFARALEIYLAGDLDALRDEALGAIPATPAGLELQARLIDHRNARMLGRLHSWLRGGGLFIAVGALHLPGPTGLVAGLRARGYRVTPVAGFNPVAHPGVP